MGIRPGVRLSYQQRGELVNRRLVPGVPHSLSWLQPRPVLSSHHQHTINETLERAQTKNLFRTLPPHFTSTQTSILGLGYFPSCVT